MRVCVILLVGGLWALMAGSCTPLLDLDAGETLVTPGRELAVSVLAPATDRTVASGSRIAIEWTAANLTDSDAFVTVLVRSREDRVETIIEGGVRLSGRSLGDTIDWNTTGFAGGRYNAIVRIEAGDAEHEDISAGVVTIEGAPTLEFTAPLADVAMTDPDTENTDNDEISFTIRWSASDPENNGKLTLNVDPDGDNNNDNHVAILERDIPAGGGFDEFAWKGLDIEGERVEGGTYRVIAVLSDTANSDIRVVATGRLIVPPKPPEPGTLEFTEPTEDVEYRPAAGVTRNFAFTLPGNEESLVDIKADSDDRHQNGNELILVSQRLEADGVASDSFQWNGTNSAGADVPDGVYRVFLVQTLASATTPRTVEAEGLVFLRREENKPLVGALTPDADQTLAAGAFLTIRWRDDTPGDAASTIVVAMDDDPNPQEGTETDDPEVELLTGRDAKMDGILDTFSYQIPSSLAPGTYHIFVYVDRDGARPYENGSKAGGRVIIRDPNMN
jgi:flagellar hook assembly protein FlgD